LINCEYFNNLNENGDMAGMGIMAGICTFPYPSPYPTEKVGDSPYPYPVNAGIPRQNGNEFGQYPRGRVYLPSLKGREWISDFVVKARGFSCSTTKKNYYLVGVNLWRL